MRIGQRIKNSSHEEREEAEERETPARFRAPFEPLRLFVNFV